TYGIFKKSIRIYQMIAPKDLTHNSFSSDGVKPRLSARIIYFFSIKKMIFFFYQKKSHIGSDISSIPLANRLCRFLYLPRRQNSHCQPSISGSLVHPKIRFLDGGCPFSRRRLDCLSGCPGSFSKVTLSQR